MRETIVSLASEEMISSAAAAATIGSTAATALTLWVGGTGNDTYVVDNVGDEVLEATGAGTDLVESYITWSIGPTLERLTLVGTADINGVGNALANRIVGNTGNNSIAGGSGNDIINGGDGADRISGGAGRDTLVGSAGADRFVFNTTLNASTNADTISDFSVAEDRVLLDNAIFTGLSLATGVLSAAAFHIGAVAADTDDRIIYDSATGALIYDSNGSAAGGDVHFARLASGFALTSDVFLVI